MADTVEKATLSSETRELLCALRAWIEFALETVQSREGRVGPTYTDGYSYVLIPEWAMRQKLAAITDALAAGSNQTGR